MVKKKANGIYLLLSILILTFILSWTICFKYSLTDLTYAGKHKMGLPNKIVLTKDNSKQFKERRIYPYSVSPDIRTVKVIAHRGQGFGGTENSLGAIENSMKSKVDYAEIDVQETKDGVVVLMHDKNLRRLTRLDKDVNQLTFNQIESLNITPSLNKRDIEKIPTLDDVIKKCNGKLNLIIEIKPYCNTEDLTNKVVQIINSNNYANQCKIHSVSYKALLDVKRLNPNIQTGYIVCSGSINNLSLLNVNFYSINDNILNRGLVNYIHSRNKEIYAWTVDRTIDINSMLKINVDGIISDKPQLLLNMKKKKTIHKI